MICSRHADQTETRPSTHAAPASTGLACARFCRRQIGVRGHGYFQQWRAPRDRLRPDLAEAFRCRAGPEFAAAGVRAGLAERRDDGRSFHRATIASAAGYGVFERSMSSGLTRGWSPVRVKKTRQIRNLGSFTVSLKR